MSNPVFQHRHYAEIAATLAKLPLGYIDRDASIDRFIDLFRRDNCKFDVGRFRAAAIGEPSNGKDRR
jgi:hypothetical protein